MDHLPPRRKRSVCILDQDLASKGWTVFRLHAWVSISFLLLPRPDHARVAGDCFPWTISLLTRSCMVCVEGGGLAALQLLEGLGGGVTSGAHPQEEAARPASLATQRETLGGSRW